MEKYRQFADGGTGVNPFVPAWSHFKSPLALRATKLLVMLPVAVLRLALFAAALLWLALAELLCLLVPVGVLRYPLYRFLSYVGCGAALLALGVVPVGAALADHRRLKLAPAKSDRSTVFHARHGMLVLANQQGLTDVLYLGLRLCPTFVFPASNGEPVQVSLLGALRRAGARRAAPAGSQTTSLADVSQRAAAGWRGPVVVFPEGARTNGSCVLSWKPRTFRGLETFERPVGTALVSLVYSKAGAYTPHHTVGTAFRHILWLILQPWHTVQATWLPAAEVTSVLKDKAVGEQAAALRTVLARMVPGAVEVEVTADKHPEFMAYWDASQRKGYTQQQQKKRA